MNNDDNSLCHKFKNLVFPYYSLVSDLAIIKPYNNSKVCNQHPPPQRPNPHFFFFQVTLVINALLLPCYPVPHTHS